MLQVVDKCIFYFEDGSGGGGGGGGPIIPNNVQPPPQTGKGTEKAPDGSSRGDIWNSDMFLLLLMHVNLLLFNMKTLQLLRNAAVQMENPGLTPTLSSAAQIILMESHRVEERTPQTSQL